LRRVPWHDEKNDTCIERLVSQKQTCYVAANMFTAGKTVPQKGWSNPADWAWILGDTL